MPDYHYQYHSDGNWAAIKDPLKGRPASQYGFDMNNFTKDLACFGLSLLIYARSSLVTSFPFKFHCHLRLKPVDCYIWVTDLPELLSLLKDLQVSRPIPYLDMLVDKASDAFMNQGQLRVTIHSEDD